MDRQTGYPSIDKPWLKYYEEADLKLRAPKCTIYKNIWANNHLFPDSAAIRYFGNKISYRQLFSKTEAVVKALKSSGVKRGDCVTLCTAGIPEALYVVLACSRIGAIANFINPLFTEAQIVERINETNAELLLVLDVLYLRMENLIRKTCIKKVVVMPIANSASFIPATLMWLSGKKGLGVIGNKRKDVTHISWSEFERAGQGVKETIEDQYEQDAPAVMVYSSGSTGASKGIVLTNDGINATILNYQMSCYPFERGDQFLQMIPIWFSTGIVLSILMPLVQGITVILEPKFAVDSFIGDLKKYKPAMTIVATSIWLSTIKDSGSKKLDLSNLKYPITGGEKVSITDEARMNAFLADHGCKGEMIKGYGMCELGSTVTASNYSPKYSRTPGGNGYPILNVTVSAFDIESDKELKYGEHGEIRVLSPARMKEYYKNPEATDQFFKKDDQGKMWGCTGDIGYVNEDGEVFVLGRATDSFRMENGKTVYLFDIEEEIFKEDGIEQCKVVDIEDNGKRVLVALIVLKQDTGQRAEEVLHKIVGRLLKTLPDYMQPAYYKVRESMPTHKNGKRDVKALREDREGLVEANLIYRR